MVLLAIDLEFVFLHEKGFVLFYLKKKGAGGRNSSTAFPLLPRIKAQLNQSPSRLPRP